MTISSLMKWGWLILLSLLLIITACSKAVQPDVKPLPMTNFYFSTVDYFNNNIYLDKVNYTLNGSYQNEKGEWVGFLQSGTAVGKNTLLRIPQASNMAFYSCVDNEDYYQKMRGYTIGNTDLWDTTNCIRKISPNYAFFPDCLLSDIQHNYFLNLSTKDGGIMGLSICEKHTAGIDFVSFQPQKVECESGWSDCDVYDAQYKVCRTQLPLNQYKCGDNVQECANILGIDERLCLTKGMEIPPRLQKDVNSCFDIGENLVNENLTLPITIQTNTYLSPTDIVTLYLLDVEYDNHGDISNEFEGRDIGMKDVKISIQKCGG